MHATRGKTRRPFGSHGIRRARVRKRGRIRSARRVATRASILHRCVTFASAAANAVSQPNSFASLVSSSSSFPRNRISRHRGSLGDANSSADSARFFFSPVRALVSRLLFLPSFPHPPRRDEGTKARALRNARARGVPRRAAIQREQQRIAPPPLAATCSTYYHRWGASPLLVSFLAAMIVLSPRLSRECIAAARARISFLSASCRCNVESSTRAAWCDDKKKIHIYIVGAIARDDGEMILGES